MCKGKSNLRESLVSIKGNNITSLYSPSIGGLLRRILVDNGISTDLRDIGKKQCDGAFSFLYEVAT